MTVRHVLTVALLAAGGMLAACGSGSRQGMSAAMSDYAAADYSAARDKAAGVARSSSGSQREDAAYLAGLAAYKAGDLVEAEGFLLTAINAGDQVTAGRAKAQLGLLRMDQQRYREAGDLFRDASQALSGDDARQAAHYAALAYQKSGDASAARTWAEVARRPSAGGEVVTVAMRQATGAAGATGAAFTLQIGAYHDRSGAEWAVRNATPSVERQGLGPVRIVESHDRRGQSIYLVQFGQFESRAAATAAKAKLGRLDYIVTSLAGAS
jgi:tetratricopeptide (TPR) repeat protein